MSIFRFQQFCVTQSESGMKVCTDSTLFGAMAPVVAGDRVLDIGSGTGLLSLILAQAGADSITAVEIERAAYEESKHNFKQSPWQERLQVVHTAVQDYAERNPGSFDLIICNPPFFQQHSPSSEISRRTARHNDTLPYTDLLGVVARLAHQTTRFYLLLPSHAVAGFVETARAFHLRLNNRVDIRGYARNRAKVSALTFGREARAFVPRLLTIYAEPGVYSATSERYLRHLLLRFADREEDESGN